MFKAIQSIQKYRSKVLLAYYVCLAAVLVFGLFQSSKQQCKALTLQTGSNEKADFITEEQLIKSITFNSKETLLGKVAYAFDLKSLEAELLENPYIKKAEVSLGVGGNLRVHLDQETPIARVVGRYGSDFYLTEEGKMLPLSSIFTPRVTVVDAFSNRKFYFKDFSDNNPEEQTFLNMLNTINEDEFLSKMVSVLKLNQDSEIEIYPEIGKQLISFGRAEDFELKLEKLKHFYEKIVPVKGWDHYSLVKLQYQHQIVCEK